MFPIWEPFLLQYVPIMVTFQMRVISKSSLREFWQKHADAEQPLRSWYKSATEAEWSSFAEVIRDYPTASFVNDRIVFNINGNKYRLIVRSDFTRHGLLIRFVGTHAEYDKIDVATI